MSSNCCLATCPTTRNHQPSTEPCAARSLSKQLQWVQSTRRSYPATTVRELARGRGARRAVRRLGHQHPADAGNAARRGDLTPPYRCTRPVGRPERSPSSRTPRPAPTTTVTSRASSTWSAGGPDARGRQPGGVAEAGAGDFIHVPPQVPHQEINASADEPVHCVVARSGQEPVMVNLDITGVEDPIAVLWSDPLHG